MLPPILYLFLATQLYTVSAFYLPQRRDTLDEVQQAAKLLSYFGTDAPACAGEIKTICPSVYEAASAAFLGNGKPSDICLNLAQHSCLGICSNGSQPVQWLDWTMSFCSSDSMNEQLPDLVFKDAWVDYRNVSATAYDLLFPWSWRVAYNASLAITYGPSQPASTADYKCPSVSSKLSSFAVVNIALLFVDLLLVRRDVVRILTCGTLGKNEKWVRQWAFSAVLSIGLNLGATILNAAITKNESGFAAVPAGELILLWSSRPRLAWIVMMFAGIQKSKRIYSTASLSALMTEFILQLVGSKYLGLTANYARKAGFLKLHALKYVPEGNHAIIMYAGALLWVVTMWVALLACFGCLGKVFLHPEDSDEDDLPVMMGVLVIFMILPFIGQWMFWVGFIKMAGDTFCPPQVWTNTGIWTGFSAAGAMLGSAF